MHWVKLTDRGGKPTWVNQERITEMQPGVEGMTLLYTGQAVAEQEGPHYYHVAVKETPEQAYAAENDGKRGMT